MITINLTKKLHTPEGFRDLSIALSIACGDSIAVTGESGSGKTTLLRIISGLTRPEKGKIAIGDNIWFDSHKKVNLPTNKRDIGFVFQDYALFPNMTVFENIYYGARDKTKVKEFIELMELKGLEKRYPHKLSGGQQQRLSLARAIAREPELLLMDEPLSALDPDLRVKLQNRIIKIHEKLKSTIILVTHDYPEIEKLCSRIITLNHGKIIQDSKSKKSKISFGSSEVV